MMKITSSTKKQQEIKYFLFWQKTHGYAVGTRGLSLFFGRMKLIGSRDLHFYDKKLIKRVRLIRRADGFYAQFCLDVERNKNKTSKIKTLGIDLGLNHFYTDSNNNQVDNPRFLRKSLQLLKKRQKQVSRKKKASVNRRKAVNRLARKHLKVSRQRKDFEVVPTCEYFQSYAFERNLL